MLHVDLDNIFTENQVPEKITDLLRRVDEEKKLVLITRDGRPAVAMLDIAQLEELSGRQVTTPPMAEAPVTPPPAPVMPAPTAMPESAPIIPPAPAPELPNTPPTPPAAPLADTGGLPDMPSDPNNGSPLA